MNTDAYPRRYADREPDSSLIAARGEFLRAIGQDKRSIALSLSEVQSLDQSLARDWGIDFYPTGSSLIDLVMGGGARSAAERFIEIHDIANDELSKRGSMSSKTEAALYDAIAHAGIFGVITSQRRHLILDALALALGIYRSLRLQGDILDVGCHAGFTTSILSRVLNRRVVGLEPSPNAIELGTKHKAFAENAELVGGRIPWQTDDRFEFVLAIDSMPDRSASVGPFLRNIGDLLVPGGVAVIVSRYWVDADVSLTRRQLRAASLGFAYADVVGGYGQIPPRFETEGCMIVVKGGTGEYPQKIRQAMESEWAVFREFANAIGRPMREKTQAFERASRRKAPSVFGTNL